MAKPLLTVLTLLQPAIIICISLYYFFLTLLHYAFILRLPNVHDFRRKWLSNLWATLGPASTKNHQPTMAPLLATAYGRVLDIGPGSGLTLPFLDPLKVTSALAVEPTVEFHALLADAAAKCGLREYSVVGKGIEEVLGDMGDEEFDTIVFCRVLCGVPRERLQEIVEVAYKSLKPGGQVLVFEHVRNERSALVGAYQELCNVVWREVLGGCELNRRTEQILRSAGEWENVEIAELKGQKSWETIPHIVGRLVKKGTPASS